MTVIPPLLAIAQGHRARPRKAPQTAPKESRLQYDVAALLRDHCLPEFPRAERALKHFLASHGGSAILRTHPDGSAEIVSRANAHLGRHHHASYAPPPRSNTTVVVHSRVNLAGRVLASGVERHSSRGTNSCTGLRITMEGRECRT